MRKIIEVTEGEGLDGLLGENVMIFAMNYIYAGKLTGVNDTCVRLDNASIVYETGKFDEAGYKDAQALPGECWYIATASIESFGRGK